MKDPRRAIMHASVASGGASAALMSAVLHTTDEAELRNTAEAALEPLLRAAVHAIDTAAGLPGEDQRAALRDVLQDYLELPKIGQVGRCRICGCVEQLACTESNMGEWFGPCAWADDTHTLCDNPDCLAAATAQEGARP